MILAEELDADWNRVTVEHAPANEKLYANPMLSVQATGNSNSVAPFGCRCAKRGPVPRIADYRRREGVERRSRLLHRANGSVIHKASNRTLEYGALADKANGTPPTNPPLKTPKNSG